MRLQRSFYGLEDAAKVWNKLPFQKSVQDGYKEMATAFCLSVKNGIIIVYYIDHLFLFVKQESFIDDIKNKSKNKFRMKHLARPKYLLGTDPK